MSTLHLRPLTSLRFIAAMMVFFSHYSGIPYSRTNQPLQSIFLEGHAGVTIFFVLSGFLITWQYFPSIVGGQFSTYGYLLKRAARILPLYWFMVALVFITHGGSDSPVFAPQPLANWTLTQGYFSGLSTSVLAPSWSLTVEVAFYMIAPLILYGCMRFADELRRAGERLVSWSVGLFVAGLGLIWLSHAAGLNEPFGFMSDFGFLTYFTIFGRGFHFCIGVFVALAYRKYGGSLWSGQSGIQIATTLFIVSLFGIGGLQILMNQLGGVIEAWYLNMLIAVCAAGLILALTNPLTVPARLLSHRLPIYLGCISYALYLFQATPIAHRIYSVLGDNPLLFYAVMNVLSAFLYEVVERPSRRFVLWLGARLRPGTVLPRPRFP